MNKRTVPQPNGAFLCKESDLRFSDFGSLFLTFRFNGDIIHFNGSYFRKTSYFTDNKCHLLLSDGKATFIFFEKESVYHDGF